jgi:hypothetical protein
VTRRTSACSNTHYLRFHDFQNKQLYMTYTILTFSRITFRVFFYEVRTEVEIWVSVFQGLESVDGCEYRIYCVKLDKFSAHSMKIFAVFCVCSSTVQCLNGKELKATGYIQFVDIYQRLGYYQQPVTSYLWAGSNLHISNYELQHDTSNCHYHLHCNVRVILTVIALACYCSCFCGLSHALPRRRHKNRIT